ncbi:MAG: hypothetical protein PHE10_04750 [Kiritimatiellae bacterium]|nr:hypothetical protein [Kiritimatiellia bacterium]
MASMKVRVYVTLSVEPANRHSDAMRSSASSRTDDKASVSVFTAKGDSRTLVAEFTVPKARQMDVVDRIVQEFEDFVPDAIDFSASFPRSEADERKAKRASERAKAKRAAAREARKDPAYRCFICGKRTKLVKTECCGRWICDDEHKYQLFSYARNSCHRNHRRFTLCAYHYDNGHKGDWKTCPKCRDDFKDELEMFVWYGTNEYNWEKLPDPPAYKPTTCAKCGKVIRLSDGGYSHGKDGYLCGSCMPNPFA